jgi:hypothetical protein
MLQNIYKQVEIKKICKTSKDKKLQSIYKQKKIKIAKIKKQR